MRILPKPISFLWDDGNVAKNLKKHKVTLQEAEELFVSEPVTVIDDEKHSHEREKRFQALGQTKTNRRLFVAFTIRDNKIRVISIRDMSKKERIAYEESKSNS